MIPCSDLFQESMRYSHTSFSQMDILYNGVVLENDVPISSGSFTTDRTSNIRYNASVEIGMYPLGLDPGSRPRAPGCGCGVG
jgi:hypothetical protein